MSIKVRRGYPLLTFVKGLYMRLNKNKPSRPLTHEWVKDNFTYDAETGVLLRYSNDSTGTILKEVGTSTGKGYMVASIFGSTYSLGRIIWLYVTGEWLPPDIFISYKDGNPRNLKFDNLYLVNNSRSKVGKKSRIRHSLPAGVYKTRDKKFYTKLCINKRKYRSNSFDTEEEAGALYKKVSDLYKLKGIIDLVNLYPGK